MSDHYYTNKPTSQHDEKVIESQVAGIDFRFQTDAGVFSKDRIDFGSRLLVETFNEDYPIALEKLFYEFGAGYGPISIALAKHYPQSHVKAFELNQRALDLAEVNAGLNKVSNIDWHLGDVLELYLEEGKADFVLTNPPIRAGKQVIQGFVDQAFNALKTGGELWLVIQKKQGAPSMEKHMEEVFGNVELKERSKGYWILASKK